MTVREFIEQNPGATLNMITPGGYVTLTPAMAADLLQGNSVDAHPGADEHWVRSRRKYCFHRRTINMESILTSLISSICIPGMVRNRDRSQ